jgi:hypothetical protein
LSAPVLELGINHVKSRDVIAKVLPLRDLHTSVVPHHSTIFKRSARVTVTMVPVPIEICLRHFPIVRICQNIRSIYPVRRLPARSHSLFAACNLKRIGGYTMCDYSLQGLPNRLAVVGEQLVTYRFPTRSVGLATPTDIAAANRRRASGEFGPRPRA